MNRKKNTKIALESEKTTRYWVLKVRLHPTAEQAALIEKTFGCCRYLWNHMLSDVQEFYAATDIHYIPTPAKYKRGAPFLAEVDSQALCSVHQNLRRAFLNFFKAPQNFHYPRRKTKKAHRDSFTVHCRPYRTGPSIALERGGFRMPKLGYLQAVFHRRPGRGWDLKFVTITKTRSGKYFASLAFKYMAPAPQAVVPTVERTLGLNHSLTHFYADSEGGCLDLPEWMARAKEKLARLQRRLARMQPGSKNYEECLQKIRLQHEHIANQRRDFIHKESRRIANAWDAVCVRDTNLVELSQKVKGTSVTDAGFGMFRECLKYKLVQQGKRFQLVDKYALTAKTCNACGHVRGTLSPKERKWVCPRCGAEIVRETNAARNIRDWGFQQMTETTETTKTETRVPNAVS